jgi:hypothetical protein
LSRQYSTSFPIERKPNEPQTLCKKTVVPAGGLEQQLNEDDMREQLCFVLTNLAKVPFVGQGMLTIIGDQLATLARVFLEGNALQDPSIGEAYEASFFL